MRPLITVLLCIAAIVMAYSKIDLKTEKTAKNIMVAADRVEQNFPSSSKLAIRKLINGCLKAGYQFLAMAYYFDRADVALPGFKKYFLQASNRQMDRVHSLLAYVNKRGGVFKLPAIDAPKMSNWSNGQRAMAKALEVEKSLNNDFIFAHQMATKGHDAHFKNYIESKFLDQQVRLIKKLGDYGSILKSLKKDTKSGLGLFIFDKDLEKNTEGI